jgi:hypothetical protein
MAITGGDRDTLPMRIGMTVVLGLTLTAIALCLTLRHSPLTVAATNGVEPTARLALIQRATTTCSTGLALPRATAALRLAFAATTGPRIALTATTGGRVLTRGAVASGWYGSAVTIPVAPLPAAHRDVTLCVHLGPLVGDVAMLGESSATASPDPDRQLPGRVSVAYLKAAQRSWWSRAGAVIDRLALGRAASGRWIVIPIVGLTAAAIALASLALTRELS